MSFRSLRRRGAYTIIPAPVGTGSVFRVASSVRHRFHAVSRRIEADLRELDVMPTMMVLDNEMQLIGTRGIPFRFLTEGPG